MRVFLSAMIVVAVLYFWDSVYNNGRLVDGLDRMGQSISHHMSPRGNLGVAVRARDVLSSLVSCRAKAKGAPCADVLFPRQSPAFDRYKAVSQGLQNWDVRERQRAGRIYALLS
jgi:hypothetical protein